MFGLMLKRSCAVQETEREHYRIHYCGVCKTVARHYSQPARMFLNFDCVFLAELLSALSGEVPGTWGEPYQSRLCMAADSEDGPLPLRYAAATNVLLAALKTDDGLRDTPTLFRRLLKRWFDRDFRKAEQEMAGFGIDSNQIWDWIEDQQRRERQYVLPEGATTLQYFAEPTAQITAAIFARGAILAGHAPDTMAQLGHQFGTLVYILDALEDLEKDRKDHAFNALQQAYPSADPVNKKTTAEYLLALSRTLQDTIRSLPLPEAQVLEYSQRLSANVVVRVSNALEGNRAALKRLRRNVSARLAARLENARSFAQRMASSQPGWVAVPRYAFSWMTVMIAPQLPREVQPAAGHEVAFAALAAGFFTALVFRRRIRRLISRLRKEIRKAGKPQKGDPDKNADKTVLIVCLILGILSLICFCICCSSAAKESVSCCDSCAAECDPDCGGCCSEACSV